MARYPARCHCGRCDICAMRTWKADYYQKNRKRLARIQANRWRQKHGKPPIPEMSDEEMDAVALEWLKREGLR